MPAFRRAGDEAAVHVVQHRLAEPGAGRNHGGVAIGVRDAALQHRQLVRLEHGDAVGERFEIVEHVRAAGTRAAPRPTRSRRSHGTLVSRATRR